jgi:Uma2 family endonuclease
MADTRKTPKGKPAREQAQAGVASRRAKPTEVGAPDLVVEVISPGESRRKLKRKLAQYFADGTRVAWVVNPEDRTVSVCHSPEPSNILGEGGQLDGGPLLPGFTFPTRKRSTTTARSASFN